MYITPMAVTTVAGADTIHTEICWVQEISAIQLSMLAIAISDILHRELYALLYDG